MWLSFAGRLTEEFVQAMGEYSNKKIEGYDNIEDFKWKKAHENVTCIAVLDAGLNSLRDWTPVINLSSQFKNVPIILYIRNKEMIPDESSLGKNVVVKNTEDVIYISALVKDMEDINVVLEDREEVVVEGEV